VPRAELFCEDIAKEYLDRNFAEFGLEDLVQDSDVRNMLRDAQKALSNRSDGTAFEKLAIAFDMLHRLISKDVTLIREPIGRGDRNLHESLLDSVKTLNILILGIDPARYRFFTANTPHISRTSSGHYQCSHRIYKNKLSDETFQTCFEFVVEIALNASR